MMDPCTTILDIDDCAFGCPEVEDWTGKPHEPREIHECLYWADMPLAEAIQ